MQEIDKSNIYANLDKGKEKKNSNNKNNSIRDKSLYKI